MKANINKAVGEFLIQILPEDLVEGLNVLATIKTPVHDKYSFEAKLEEHPGDEKFKNQLIQKFTPQDFPIFSIQNAFEKFFAKYQPFPTPFPSLPFPPVDLPDFPDRPSACEVYYRTFGTLAANCACRVYGEAMRDGFNSFQATIIGHFAGKRAELTGRCEI